MNPNRQRIVETMLGWLGATQGSAQHHAIIDIYNTINPLPRSYRVTYSDNWCAATVSAAFQAVGLASIMYPECSCTAMVNGAKGMGLWKEGSGYAPTPGDIVIYNWQNGNYHTGIVTSVSGTTVTVTEGNNTSSGTSKVANRSYQVGWQYVWGYIIPQYDEEESEGNSVNRCTAKIKLADIAKLSVVFGKGRSLAEIKKLYAPDYIINGGFYDGTNKPVGHLKVDGTIEASETWTTWGYAWNEGPDIDMVQLPVINTENYLSCFALYTPWDSKDKPLSYSDEIGGVRGRSGIGLMNGYLLLFCSKDGSADAMTPEQLRSTFVSWGASNALMLDSGGSSQCDLNGETVYSSRKVNNYILVWLKKDPGTYRVNVPGSTLNIRSGPTTSADKLGWYKDKDVVTVLRQVNGWGVTDLGWIYMVHTVKVEDTNQPKETALSWATGAGILDGIEATGNEPWLKALYNAHKKKMI